MRIREQLLITVLVVMAMIAGFAARTHMITRDPEKQVLRGQDDSHQMSAYAPTSSSSDVGVRSDVDLRPLEVFYSALQHVREDYVEPIQKSQEHELTYGALRVMLDSLKDPQTRFLDPAQATIAEQARAGRFDGIGAVLWVKQTKQEGATDESVEVVSTLPGSPARKAGLVTGDIITELDGHTLLPYDPFQRVEKMIKATRNGQLSQDKLEKLLESENVRIKNGIGFQKAADQLMEKGDKEMTLTVSRQGNKTPLKIKIRPAETVVDPVTYAKINPSIGYIHLNMLTVGSEKAVSEALSSFKKDGVRSIVLDLRDCPGGTLESLQGIAGDLMADRKLSVVQLPQGKQRTINGTLAQGSASWIGPFTVVVNHGTAGVTEVLAAAMRDGVGAKLVGSPTFGDNLQQTMIPLKDGSAVTMTTGRYLTPRGVNFAAKGLAPDITAASPVPAVSPSGDPVIAKAVQVLTTGKARG